MNKEVKEKLPVIPSGKDEMNLVEFPITLLSKRHTSSDKTIEFTDTIIGENNKIINRNWIVTGSDKFGLPLIQDNDVWLAILLIGKEQCFESRKINFSRYSLCKMMNWKKGGNKYKRIEDALNRLSGVRVYAKNSFWDNEKKGYITKNFGIIDDYEILDAGKHYPGQEFFPFSYVNLNEVIFKSIKSGYIKNLDIQLYFSLNSVIAKRLYRYLDKKRYGRGKFEINLFTLAYSHLGFNPETYKYPSDIKRKLNKAHKELKETGYLKSASYVSTADGKSEKVSYRFVNNIKNSKGDRLKELGEKNKLLERLLLVGVTQGVAEQLIRDYSAEVVNLQLEALSYRKAKDPAAFLVSSIQENWAFPSEFMDKLKSKERSDGEISRQKKEFKDKRKRREKIERYIDSLSKDEAIDLEKRAKERAYEEGGDFLKGKDLPPMIIKSYVFTIAKEKLGL